MLPIYLSSPAFNFVAMSSYDHFCFLQHICTSAFPSVNPNTILPSAEGSLHDVLAETCFFYTQNLPMIVMLLPYTGLALALLLLFFSPECLPGGLLLSDVDQSIACRDGMFFNKSTGALTHYAKGVLIANAAWAAWRVLVLLLSWYVRLTCSKKYMLNEYRCRVSLWIFSRYGCTGLCRPCSCKKEKEIGRTVSIHSEKSESGLGPAMGTSGVDVLPWSWKECTLLHMYEVYKFCLTLRALCTEKSAENPPSGGFEGIEKVFAAVGLGGAVAQPQQGCRGKLLQDLFKSPGRYVLGLARSLQMSHVLMNSPKTIQTVSFLSYLFHKMHQYGPFLKLALIVFMILFGVALVLHSELCFNLVGFLTQTATVAVHTPFLPYSTLSHAFQSSLLTRCYDHPQDKISIRSVPSHNDPNSLTQPQDGPPHLAPLVVSNSGNCHASVVFSPLSGLQTWFLNTWDLVIIPLSTITAWQWQFQTWAPNLNVITYISTASARKVISISHSSLLSAAPMRQARTSTELPPPSSFCVLCALSNTTFIMTTTTTGEKKRR